MTPSAPKLRQVFTLLAVQANQFVHTDQVIEELWENRPPSSATTTMQSYIYQLRKLLSLYEPPEGVVAEEALRTLTGGYVLMLPPDALDVQQFEQLAERGRAMLAVDELQSASTLLSSALRLWRGAALTALDSGPILQAEAVRLEAIHKSVLEQRIEADLRLGRHYELLGELSGLVAQQPDHEGFQAKLMLALYRAGRRSEALQTYQQARKVIARELGLEPSAELQRLHSAILAADPVMDMPAARARGSVVVSSAPPPNRLPSRPAALIGRDRPLAALRAGLRRGDGSGPAPLVVTVGAPGVGKSAFCVGAAHQVAGGYPDGQLYAQLTGVDGTPADPSAILAEFLMAMGMPPERMPGTLAERSRRFQAWTQQNRVLVVLDDATSSAQLVPLLATGPGSATIVASRRRLSDPRITLNLTLRPLTRPDGVKLLDSMLAASRPALAPEASGALVDRCNGLPLALRIAATKLDLRPHWSVERLLPRLFGDAERLPELTAGLGDDLPASLRRNHDLMPPQAQQAFQVLVAHGRRHVTDVILADLLGVDRICAEGLLEELVEHQLAEIEGGGPVGLDGFGYRIAPIFHAAARALFHFVAEPRSDDSMLSTAAVR